MMPPYQFYRTYRPCPSCHAVLATITPLNRQFTQGLLQQLGITCYCVRCNNRYRATSWLRFIAVAWAGPLGRWLWWKSVRLELTVQPGPF